MALASLNDAQQLGAEVTHAQAAFSEKSKDGRTISARTSFELTTEIPENMRKRLRILQSN